jgi:hypothetical protein
MLIEHRHCGHFGTGRDGLRRKMERGVGPDVIHHLGSGEFASCKIRNLLGLSRGHGSEEIIRIRPDGEIIRDHVISGSSVLSSHIPCHCDRAEGSVTLRHIAQGDLVIDVIFPVCEGHVGDDADDLICGEGIGWPGREVQGLGRDDSRGEKQGEEKGAEYKFSFHGTDLLPFLKISFYNI